MATLAKVNDRLPNFRRSLYRVLDDAIGEAAKDTLIDAKNKAPYKDGALRRESDTRQMSMAKHRVSFWVEYARFQEFGGDARRRVRNYSTGGTGKAYLKTAGDNQGKKLVITLKKHAARARA